MEQRNAFDDFQSDALPPARKRGFGPTKKDVAKAIRDQALLNKQDAPPAEPQKPAMTKTEEQAACSTYGELVELGKRRGYQKAEAWAAHVFAAREARKEQRT